MTDVSRRAALRIGGGTGLAALFAPFAGKVKPPPIPGPAFLPSTSSGVASRAIEIVRSGKAKALSQLIDELWSRHHNMPAARDPQIHQALDFDIAALKSVRPWAKAIMQEQRRKEREEYLRGLRGMLDRLEGRGLDDNRIATQGRSSPTSY